MLRKLRQHQRVVAAVDHDGDVGVVLGGGADHGRPADVDVFDRGRELGVARDGCLERIEIDHQQIDRRDAVLPHRLRVLAIVADRQQAAMHFWMQRFDPAVHHFGKAGEFGDVGHLQSRCRDRFRGAAGRHQVDTVPGKRAGKIDQAGFVGNGQQGAGHAPRMVGHKLVPGYKARRVARFCVPQNRV